MGDTLLSKRLALPIFAVRPALVGRLRDRGGARRPASERRPTAPTSSCRSRSRSPPSSGSSSSRTRRPSRPTRSSGGAYVVAKENLGTLPSLVAAAALLVDYVLTVAVSVAAGVLAITSAAPSLAAHEVALSLALHPAPHGREPARRARVGLRVRAPHLRVHRRDVRDDRDRHREVRGRRPAPGARPAPDRRRARPAASACFVILRAFASGSAALTGVESISNGVNAFRPPQGRNAAKTLRRDGRDGDLALRRRLVAGRAHAREPERHGVGRLGDRARRLPGRLGTAAFMYYVVQGLTFADAGPRREHLLPGLPAARRRARPRPLLPAPVRQPRRPARLLERDHRARRRSRRS